MREGRRVSTYSPIKPPLKYHKIEDLSFFSIKHFRTHTKSPTPLLNESNCGKTRANSQVFNQLSKIKPLIDLNAKQSKDTLKPAQIKSKEKLRLNISKALFTVTSSEEGISADSIIELFLGLGYSSDYESLKTVLKAVTPNPFLPYFSKKEIRALMKDKKLNRSLKIIVKELKDSGFAYMPQEFDTFILVLKKWWAKLDYSKTGFVSSEEVCSFLKSIELFESNSELIKVFSKLSQFMSFSQFLAVFAKGLFQFLLIQLFKDSSQSILPLDITLNEKKRKVFLKGLKGENKVLKALLGFSLKK